MLLLIGLSAATARPAEQTLAVEAADDPGGLCHPARPWAAPLAFTPVSSPAVHRRQVAGPLWLRTTLVNPTPQPVRRVVTVWFPYLDEVMLIAADRTGRIDAARHGASIPRPADALPSAVPAFAVTLPAQDSMKVLICIRSSAIIIAPLLVLGETAFWRAAMIDAAKVAIMLGVIAAALVYGDLPRAALVGGYHMHVRHAAGSATAPIARERHRLEATTRGGSQDPDLRCHRRRRRSPGTTARRCRAPGASRRPRPCPPGGTGR
ncbi:7TM-DISM domain-containing protein [Elioraea sp.]|uniref:7TMR-DISMED2 domain-containing protein n=1 Tax=Elioraea sp. TaxID=2185103 RepID=UPI002621E97E|nr:7TM-DISM domain-containing protein [Elioraea sp.]